MWALQFNYIPDTLIPLIVIYVRLKKKKSATVYKAGLGRV